MENTEKKPTEWYVVHTYSGYEKKVKANLEQRRESMNMEDNIFRVIVPEKEVNKTNPSGESKKVIENDFPGYVLVEMDMTNDSWFVVRNTPGVTGFLGSHGQGSKPIPMTQEEIDRILKRVGEPVANVVDIDAKVGEPIQIINGPFSGQEGKITSIDNEKQTVEVIIEVFGRETPTEIDFADIDSII